MKKLVLFALILMVPCVLFAQSSKTAVMATGAGQIQATSIVGAQCGTSWDDIAIANIHTSSQKDLILGASLETSLFTRTLVKSKGGTSDSTTAMAELKVRVLVDGTEAAPGEVTYDRRAQTLMAKFNGICTDLNGDNIVTYDECDNYEELELTLDTTAAHHFNFLIANVGTGDHYVQMQGCVDNGGSATNGSWDADATARVGTLTVEEVRLVNGSDVSF